MSSLIHASTSLLRSRSQFVSLIDRLKNICRDDILLYSLSHDTPDLEHSVKQLGACTKETIGCLSAPLPLRNDQPFFSCSVAVLKSGNCRPFSSLKTGNGPVQVGRWHAFRKKESDDNVFDGLGGQDLDGDINWKELWNTKSSARFLPQELKDVTNARSLIYFSDHSSWDLASAIHEHLPHSHQLGFMASSTPFVTGQPFTLLRNGTVQSSGAVGIALSSPPSETVLRFDGLVQLTRSLPVHRAEGNLIFELGESLPARILLKAIQDHKLPDDKSKDVEYYIGTRDAATADEKTPPRLLRIIAGSPSRGSIAVEEVAAPLVGSLVEFYFRPKSLPVQLPSDFLLGGANSDVLFGALVDNIEYNLSGSPSSFPISRINKSDTGSPESYESSFIMSAEQGFVLTAGKTGKAYVPWKCTVPGTFGGLRFPGGQ